MEQNMQNHLQTCKNKQHQESQQSHKKCCALMSPHCMHVSFRPEPDIVCRSQRSDAAAQPPTGPFQGIPRRSACSSNSRRASSPSMPAIEHKFVTTRAGITDTTQNNDVISRSLTRLHAAKDWTLKRGTMTRIRRVNLK